MKIGTLLTVGPDDQKTVTVAAIPQEVKLEIFERMNQRVRPIVISPAEMARFLELFFEATLELERMKRGLL